MAEPQSVGIEPAKAVDIITSVTTGERSILSRILFKTSQGSVTLFAFDEGQSLSEHTTPYGALVQVLAGALELTVGGRLLVVHSGQMALMPAQVPHAVLAPEKTKWLLTMLKE
jgi:quercetin dioxygenase-like cupin family protein